MVVVVAAAATIIIAVPAAAVVVVKTSYTFVESAVARGFLDLLHQFHNRRGGPPHAAWSLAR